MKIKCIVAAINASGSPDLFFTIVECSQSEYDNGDHYDMADLKAEQEGYEPKLVFDENDPGGQAMLDLFDWDSLS